MSSAALRFCSYAILLVAQSVSASPVKSHHHHQHHEPAHHHHHQVHPKVNSLLRSQVEEEWHAHGEEGKQWRWTKNEKGEWERKTITDEEAEQADPPGKPDTDLQSRSECTTVPGAKVSLDVYYESRCPGCLLFINKTLEPLWRTPGLKDVLNISMVTFGNSRSVPVAEISEGYKFFHPETAEQGWDTVQICQHGSDECFGNLIHLCSQHVTDDHDKYMELIFCTAAMTIDGFAEENSAYQCMEKAGIDKDKVRECVTSKTGNQLMEAAGKVTAELKDRQGTPWVMVAGAHVEDHLLVNKTLMTQSVCSHVCNVPEPCAPFKNKDAAKAAPAPVKVEEPDFQVFTNEEFIKVNQHRV